MNKEADNLKVVLTRDELIKEKNHIKEKFVPQEGFRIRFPGGSVYKVVFSNVGQLRFTALFDCFVQDQEEIESQEVDIGK